MDGIGGTSMAGSMAPIRFPAMVGADPLIRRQQDFSSTLMKARSSGSASGTPEQRAREAAEEFVSVALVQPILGKLRDSNQAAPPFRPTRGEQQFQGLADAQVARQIVRSSHFPLVDRLARDLLRKHEESAATPPVGTEATRT